MFGTIKGFIPEPRQADQPRNYVGRHRHAEASGHAPARRTDTDADPDAPTRELASAAANAMAPDIEADSRS